MSKGCKSVNELLLLTQGHECFRMEQTSSDVRAVFELGFSALAWGSHERYCQQLSSIKMPGLFRLTIDASSFVLILS